MTDRRGWFADHATRDDDDYDPNYPWRPYLQIDGACVQLGIWFATKDECERFIRDEVLGKRLLPDD